MIFPILKATTFGHLYPCGRTYFKYNKQIKTYNNFDSFK